MKNFVKYRVEMLIPQDMDPSALLELLGEFCVDQAEEYPAEDDDGDEVELSDDDKEALRNEVSVEEIPSDK